MGTINRDIAFGELCKTIEDWLCDYEEINVLEAGGGSLSHITFSVKQHITVVDISPEQLQRNNVAEHKILGDLHTVDLGVSKYDAVVCYDVIEHLENPKLVVQKLFQATRPGGVVVLAAPNPLSLSARITKYTPLWFHVFVLRSIFGNKNAGKPGFPPFKTVHHVDIEPDRLKSLAADYEMEILYFRCYESSRRTALRTKSPMFGLLFDMTIATGNIISKYPLELSDMYMVLQRRAYDRTTRLT